MRKVELHIYIRFYSFERGGGGRRLNIYQRIYIFFLIWITICQQGLFSGDAFANRPTSAIPLYTTPKPIYLHIYVTYTYRIRLIFFPRYGIQCDRIKYILFVVSVRRRRCVGMCRSRYGGWRVLLKKHLSRSCLHIMGLCRFRAEGYAANIGHRTTAYVYIYNLQWTQYAITCNRYLYMNGWWELCVCGERLCAARVLNVLMRIRNMVKGENSIWTAMMKNKVYLSIYLSYIREYKRIHSSL